MQIRKGKYLKKEKMSGCSVWRNTGFFINWSFAIGKTPKQFGVVELHADGQ